MFKKTAGATKQAVLEKMGKAHSTQTTETSEQLQQLATGIKAKKAFVKDFGSGIEAIQVAADKLGKTSTKMAEICDTNNETVRLLPRNGVIQHVQHYGKVRSIISGTCEEFGRNLAVSINSLQFQTSQHLRTGKEARQRAEEARLRAETAARELQHIQEKSCEAFTGHQRSASKGAAKDYGGKLAAAEAKHAYASEDLRRAEENAIQRLTELDQAQDA
eukprot:CAMPEP_0198218000 /NCGR_PEP_ID=MMETSP1445-20131203/66858_1 /TAXON_ID=36898 /ORGANISM="Pyramimonas sp., Strain CCMP2087" /LENGTH=217 /DNA_ID=CAMNT_0043894875 /DNA_START=93 /DNA_END=742 /DNA_ORIENTATION=-